MKMVYQECFDCMWMAVNTEPLEKCPDCGQGLNNKEMEFPMVVYIQLYDDDGDLLAEPSFTAGEDRIYNTDQQYIKVSKLPGVIFGDGEFVHIDDEFLMQMIAEQLPQED